MLLLACKHMLVCVGISTTHKRKEAIVQALHQLWHTVLNVAMQPVPSYYYLIALLLPVVWVVVDVLRGQE